MVKRLHFFCVLIVVYGLILLRGEADTNTNAETYENNPFFFCVTDVNGHCYMVK
jgi:hypothetical protein